MRRAPWSDLFGHQADVIHTRGTNFIHHLDHIAVLGATVTLDEDGLVQFVGDEVTDLIRNLGDVGLGVAQVDVPARRDATMMASSLSASGISLGLLTFANSTDKPLVSMGVTTMKMISSTSMMSAIGMTFGADICAPTLGLYAMAYFFPPARRVMK